MTWTSLAVLLLSGCAPRADPLLDPQRPTKQIRLTVVVRSSAGILLSQAAVTVDGATQITTATGVVVFAAMARQTYTVTVVHAGYQTWTNSGRWASDSKLVATLQPSDVVSLVIVAAVPVPR